ncbi:MAG: hypothetical protein ACD_78C00025G0004, partial [uncultured bacterium (gcode 4)]
MYHSSKNIQKGTLKLCQYSVVIIEVCSIYVHSIIHCSFFGDNQREFTLTISNDPLCHSIFLLNAVAIIIPLNIIVEIIDWFPDEINFLYLRSLRNWNQFR